MNKEVLKRISMELNKLNCTWGVGGSVMLNHYGLVDNPRDIDILIDSRYAKEVKEFMNGIGEYVQLESKAPFKTKEFFGYVVDSIMVEFLGDFKIDLGDEGIYEFILDDMALREHMMIDDVKVNLTSLEDWFVAYGVMGDPKSRVPLLKEYFEKHGLKYRGLLERNLKNNIQGSVKEYIKNMI